MNKLPHQLQKTLSSLLAAVKSSHSRPTLKNHYVFEGRDVTLWYNDVKGELSWTLPNRGMFKQYANEDGSGIMDVGDCLDMHADIEAAHEEYCLDMGMDEDDIYKNWRKFSRVNHIDPLCDGSMPNMKNAKRKLLYTIFDHLYKKPKTYQFVVGFYEDDADGDLYMKLSKYDDYMWVGIEAVKDADTLADVIAEHEIDHTNAMALNRDIKDGMHFYSFDLRINYLKSTAKILNVKRIRKIK